MPGKKAEKKRQYKKKKSILMPLLPWAVSFILGALIGFGGGVQSITGSFGLISTYVEVPPGAFEAAKPVRIVSWQKESTGDALFDISLTIPAESRRLAPYETLLVQLDLINFGGPGRTDTSISYIITNSFGDILTIEHERRAVETQESFFREIDVSNLQYGDYTLFVEMLYSNTSAIASGEFSIA
ncbi:hypothetical protein KY358_00535 [Candidatus Woesearchaeota archaeon]|nr:hypothetical protein [Candidatus Woesearchaeota archaeon]